LSDAAKAGFVKYLASGGGLVIIHFANGAFHFSLPEAGESDWPEFRKICRRVWDHTKKDIGHDPYGRFKVAMTDLVHPITQGMRAFETTDELYFRQQGAEPIEVLATARSKVTGQLEPMAFVYPYGKGRVFQTVLGHDAASLRTPGPSELIQRAAAWAAGRGQYPRGMAKHPAIDKKPTEVAGHWGEDAVGFRWTDDRSRDGRWHEMDTGQFFSGSIDTPGQPTLKGIAVRIGDENEAAVCYDTDLLRVSAGWTGAFLRFNSKHFGLVHRPRATGKTAFVPPAVPGWAKDGSFEDSRPHKPWGPLPRQWAHYKGLYLHGKRVVFAYTVGTAEVLESPWFESIEGVGVFSRTFEIGPHPSSLTLQVCDGNAEAAVIDGPPGTDLRVRENASTLLVIPAQDKTIRLKLLIWSRNEQDRPTRDTLIAGCTPSVSLRPLTEPGPKRWTAPIVTRGVVSERKDAYVVDTLTLPFENPYNALMFTSGHDFFSNGDAAVCTVHGDVWRVSGIDERLERLTWTRMATGLYHPLGLKIVDDRVYVVGRDQITILHDRNGDGEADYYENFNNDGQVTPNTHEYAACLETDSQGNFYYVKGDSHGVSQHDGCLLRVAADGSKLDVVATGFRNANGMSIGPDDVITVAPQEGDWTPGSCINDVRQGGFYGAMQAHHRATPPTDYDKPMCWIPRLEDNSSGGQVWVTGDRWGPLQGQLLHLAYGTCRMLLAMREPVNGRMQGGTVSFPLVFDSGAMRGRFRPNDGQLYVTGLLGWVSRAAKDGCFQRVRYTGAPVRMPVKVRTHQNGLAITFTCDLDPDGAEDIGNYHVEQWNYRWSKAYGSPEFKVSDPTQVGRDEVEVVSATLLDDGRTVFLELEDLQPVMQMGIGMLLASADGAAIRQTVNYTLHAIPDTWIEPSPREAKPRPGTLSQEERKGLQPGLIARFRQNDATGIIEDARHARMAALHIPRDTPVSPFLQPGPYQATFEGYLRVRLKGSYRFSLKGNGVATLQIGGQEVLVGQGDLSAGEPVSVTLPSGFVRIALRYDSPSEGDATVRLYWQSPSFAAEPLPPTVLYSDSDDAQLTARARLRRGREVFAAYRCVKCHALPATVQSSSSRMPELDRDAPDLTDVASRLRSDWMARWLLDPQRVRNHVSMPRLFDAHDPADRQAVADIVAYLAPAQLSTDPSSDSADASRIAVGHQLYDKLGCVGCHRFTPPDAEDRFDRTSLHFVGRKFLPGALATFLRAPQAHYAWGAMPDFRLTPTEAEALATFLRSQSITTRDANVHMPAGDSHRGKSLFSSTGCANCHQRQEAESGHDIRLTARFGTKQDTGCMAPPTARTGNAPTFLWREGEREALGAFLATDGQSLSRHAAMEVSRRYVRALNCQACHDRDGRTSAWLSIQFDEEKLQDLTNEAVPMLTWTGEKLKPDWVARRLRGDLSYKPRPWLHARMPKFPLHADALAAGLAAEHGFGITAEPSFDARPELASIGRRLTSVDGGLKCRQCHGEGDLRSTADAAANIAPGINHAYVRERLRYDFFMRLMLDPMRYNPRSKMPQFAMTEQRTAITDVYHGDALRQFEAIWHYLHTLEAAETPPRGDSRSRQPR
jgi:mono/diheme cytochrome c family protein